jgi:glycosyltransferase involved in cell wall biosynthesis
MKFTLLIPTINEIDGMRVIMPRIKRDWCDQIIILDGRSTDGTIEYAREQGFLTVIQQESGLRHGYMEAMPYVTGDVLITFSPDGNSVPELIPPLIEKMRQGHDMVIVSRYAEGAKSEDDDYLTSFGNWLFNKLINLFFHAKYTDAMVIFRAYRTNLVYELNLDKDSSYRPEKWFDTKVSWEPLLSIRGAKQRLKIAEIPGDEPPRIGGKRKLLPFRWGATFLMQIFIEFFSWR